MCTNKDIYVEKKIIYDVSEILVKNKLTISTVESCTGGMVSASLIEFPGISEVFLEGAITYSNEAKVKRLGVKQDTLNNYGAVSEETAKEMVSGIAEVSNSKVAISTTGLAGPGGGTKDKPVGLVYVGIYIEGNIVVLKNRFSGTRNEIRAESTRVALKTLKDELIKIGYK